jgi:Kef-type K+ transport system membrane component KefB/voltage-gated potassium channel Kch
MAENIFFQITIILGITVSIAFVTRMLRQPLIVAYIIAGLVAGPLFLNLVNGGQAFFDTFAQFGIVLLLFLVGLSLNFNYIRRVGKAVIITTLVHFLFAGILGLILMMFLDFGFVSALFLSISVSFASTIIVTKLLSEKKDMEAVYGRFTVGVLLVQDVVAIVLMIFLTTHQEGAIWYQTFLTVASRGMFILAVIVLMAKYLLPYLMDRVAKSGELLFIFTIAWCFGVASLVYWAGFNIEIGAIIAGLSLGASAYQPEIISRVKPLRDFFIVLFFVVLGSELQLGQIKDSVGPALVLSVFVLIVDPVLLYFVMRWLKYGRRSSVLAGLTAANVSEFGFILVFKGQEIGYLQGNELGVLTMVALITISISSYFIVYNEQIYRALLPLLNRFGPDLKQKEEVVNKEYSVWVFGYHRIGWKVCEALSNKGVEYAVVDFNPESISKLKRRGIPAYFGDAADVEFLEMLHLDKAKLIISTIPEADDQKTMITHVRRLSDKPVIIANLYHNTYLEDLYEAGANYVMMPHLLGGQWISEVLTHHSWTKETFKKLRTEQKDEMRLRYSAGTHS